MPVTTKSLFTQVVDLIQKKATTTSYGVIKASKTSRRSSDLASIVSTATTEDVISAMSDLLAHVIEPRIISGLQVIATTPASTQVVVKAGTGTGGGKYYTLTEDVNINVPLETRNSVYYVNLYSNGVKVENKTTSLGLTVAKIIANYYSVAVKDTKDDSSDAYIQSFIKYNLYGTNDKFEEDTVSLLRDNIGEILADNLIGNLRLSENLKITNTVGCLELDSSSLKIYSASDDLLVKLNQRGLFLNRADGVEVAKFTADEARVGNIVIEANAIESANFLTGVRGFQIASSGNAEFNDIVVRGTIYATEGEIGGFTIGDNELYATTTGTIKTSINAGSGYNGVVLDKDGLRVYDDILGLVVNLPSDGSAPTFSSGIINSTIFEINTNAILRTSETVGDGTASSAGILINNTGLYGCGANQTLNQANLKMLATGDAYFSGEINATSGNIGNISLVSGNLSGGTIVGTLIRGAAIESSDTVPRIRIDTDGIYYQIASNVGTYGAEGSGLTGFLYGDGTVYGTGATAYLFNANFPVLAITSELTDTADIRLYNRGADPTEGTHELGDLIVVTGYLKICETAGTPGIFDFIAQSNGDTGGTGSAGSGKQYIELNIGGTRYKVLHDGIIT